MISGLILAVLTIGYQQERYIEEQLFSLSLANIVLFNTLPGITRVPVETNNFTQIDHLCILPSYTSLAIVPRKPCGGSTQGVMATDEEALSFLNSTTS
jgi:hypothetical protein